VQPVQQERVDFGADEDEELVSQQPEERGEMARRCAWCKRVFVRGKWIPGRRAEDAIVHAASTHTICDECVTELRRKGLSV
jgi:hypothetical protein